MIGDPIHCKNESRQNQLLLWLDALPKSKDKNINIWKKEAKDVLNKKIDFIYDYWCDPALNRMVSFKNETT